MGLQITLLYFDGCPSWQAADARLREALRLAGVVDAEVAYRKVETPEEAARLRFRGSPTLVIDGQDPFADETTPVGLSCRIYQTASGPAGAPTVDQLQAVLRRRQEGPAEA